MRFFSACIRLLVIFAVVSSYDLMLCNLLFIVSSCATIMLELIPRAFEPDSV